MTRRTEKIQRSAIGDSAGVRPASRGRLRIETVCDLEDEAAGDSDGPSSPDAAADSGLVGDLEPAAREVCDALGDIVELPPHASVVIALSGDETVRRLNRTWRGLDKPTNVLSFPSPAAPVPALSMPALPVDTAQPGRFIGDVVLALPTLLRESAEMAIPPGHHLRHLVLHGVLHLLGHDHETDEEALAMETLETRVLDAIGVPDPYRVRTDDEESDLEESAGPLR